jgi:hypothetical protein
VVGGEDGGERLGVQGDSGQALVIGARGAAVFYGDGEFDLAVQELGDRLVAFGISYCEVQAGCRGPQGGERGGDEEADSGGEGRHPDFAGGAFGVLAEGLFGAFDLGEDRVGVTQQKAAC